MGRALIAVAVAAVAVAAPQGGAEDGGDWVQDLSAVEVLALSPERGRAVVRIAADAADVPADAADELVLLAVGDPLPGTEGARVAAVLPGRLEVEVERREDGREEAATVHVWLFAPSADGAGGNRMVVLDSRSPPAPKLTVPDRPGIAGTDAAARSGGTAIATGRGEERSPANDFLVATSEQPDAPPGDPPAADAAPADPPSLESPPADGPPTDAPPTDASPEG